MRFTVLHQLGGNCYPMVLQAGPLLGDGVKFRVLLADRPFATFKNDLIFGTAQNEFETRNTRLLAQGYTLIYHQTDRVMRGTLHQAVWVKD